MNSGGSIDIGSPVMVEAFELLSPERDYYIKHDRNYSGCAWLWLHRRRDYGRVEDCLRGLAGVEEVLPSEEAAVRFHLPRERIGDMVITGDRDTMFADMHCTYAELEPSYRAHGSLHEMEIPLAIYNYGDSFSSTHGFTVNLVQFLYR